MSVGFFFTCLLLLCFVLLCKIMNEFGRGFSLVLVVLEKMMI